MESEGIQKNAMEEGRREDASLTGTSLAGFFGQGSFWPVIPYPFVDLGLNPNRHSCSHALMTACDSGQKKIKHRPTR